MRTWIEAAVLAEKNDGVGQGDDGADLLNQ